MLKTVVDCSVHLLLSLKVAKTLTLSYFVTEIDASVVTTTLEILEYANEVEQNGGRT